MNDHGPHDVEQHAQVGDHVVTRFHGWSGPKYTPIPPVLEVARLPPVAATLLPPCLFPGHDPSQYTSSSSLAPPPPKCRMWSTCVRVYVCMCACACARETTMQDVGESLQTYSHETQKLVGSIRLSVGRSARVDINK